MRLIDADKLINRISELFRNDDLYLVGKFIGLISQQPVAFDVEKVVSELEESYFITESTFDDDGYCNDDSEEVVNLNEEMSKRKLYKIVLKMILKDRNELSLTSKQKSQVESLIKKCN